MNLGKSSGERAMTRIYEAVKKLLADGKFVGVLGGEHTISQAPIKAHLEKYPGLSVIHFDAHADLRESYEGSKYSHACIMARVCEFMDPLRIAGGFRAAGRSPVHPDQWHHHSLCPSDQGDGRVDPRNPIKTYSGCLRDVRCGRT
jgi:arginase family enzyme